VVFDDFHLLAGHDQSLALIDYLVETSPPRLRFLLISRWNIPLKSRVLKFGREALKLTNQDLALSEEEAMALLDHLTGEAPSLPTVRELHRATDGWIMGLILAGHALGHGAGAVDISRRKGEILDYFKEEIYRQLPERFRRGLLMLSLLDEIPAELAAELTGLADAGGELKRLMEQNYFVRSLNEENTLFGLHHLFREFLQERARRELGEEAIREILRKASRFWIAQDRPQEAMRYALHAGDFDTLEGLLAQEGLKLMAMNRVMTLAGLLKGIPRERIAASGWFSYFLGVVTELVEPFASLPAFETALRNFVRDRNLVGELLACAEIINFHMAYDGSYNKGAQLLHRAEELFVKHGDTLDTYTRILLAHDLASGFCFFEMDMEKADHYSRIGLALAKENGLDNFVGRIRIIQGFERLLQGDYEGAAAIADRACPLLFSQGVDVISKAGLRTLFLDLLVKTGQFERFAAFHRESTATVEGAIFPKAITGPLIEVWRADVAIATGRFDKAEQILRQAISSGFYSTAPHLRSQFLQYLALVCAIGRREDEARAAIEEALALRSEVGGPYYLVLADFFAGAVYAHLGEEQEALVALDRAESRAASLNIDYFIACIEFYRAFLHQRARRPKKAGESLARGLGVMRRHHYRHLHGWVPSMMEELLALAVEKGIEPEYAADLARERLALFLVPGCPSRPMLEVSVLGEFRVAFGRVTFAAGDFTPIQRALLALLLCAHGHRIRQEQVQELLWPESEPSKSRSKFDSTLLRLRKTLAGAVGEEASRQILVLRKGFLELAGCRMDGDLFLFHGREGLSALRDDRLWAASNHFEQAFGLLGPCVVEGFSEAELVSDYTLRVRMMAEEVALAWGEKLVGLRRLADAARVVSQAVRIDPMNDQLVQLLHHVHLLAKEPHKAKALLKEYEETLAKNDYSPEEIHELITAVQEPPTFSSFS